MYIMILDNCRRVRTEFSTDSRLIEQLYPRTPVRDRNVLNENV